MWPPDGRSGPTAVLHFSLQAKAGADPNAPEMSGLRVQEEPSFSFGQELVRVNPVDALAGAADGNGRLDQVSFNLPAILKAAGSLGRKSKRNNYLQGAQGNRFQPVEEPVFSTLRTTESVEGCQPGSIVVLLTGYDTTGAVIATKEQLLPTACQWQPEVFRLPLREIGQGVHFISWRIINSGPSEVYLDELQLQTVEVVQEHHYHPYGLELAGLSKTRDLLGELSPAEVNGNGENCTAKTWGTANSTRTPPAFIPPTRWPRSCHSKPLTPTRPTTR